MPEFIGRWEEIFFFNFLFTSRTTSNRIIQLRSAHRFELRRTKYLPAVIYSRSYCSGLFFQTTQTVNLKNNQNDLSRIKQQIIQNKQYYFLFRRDMMQCPFAFYCNSNSFVLNSRLTYLGYFGTRKSLNESFEWKSRTEAKNHKVCFYLKHKALPQSKLNERSKVACEKKDPTVHLSSIIVTYNILRFLLDELAVTL